MGRGDEHELVPTEHDLAVDEAAIRKMLGQSGEPAMVEPPPDLATRVLASLTDQSTRSARRLQSWWVPTLGGLASLTLLLLLLGGLMVALDATSTVASSPDSRMVLALSQLAQPLLATLRSFGVPLILFLLVLLLATLLWQRVRRQE